MKPILLTGLLLTASLTALAQGKVGLINDDASLAVLTTDLNLLLPADRPLAGKGADVLLLSGKALLAGLYGGTSSSGLFLYSAFTLTGATTPSGMIPSTQIVLNANPATGAPAIPGIANGTAITAATPWLQVRIWDSAYATYELAWDAYSYIGSGAEFQFNPGPSLSYPLTAPASVNSTWTDGPMIVHLRTPEPSSLALIGLGAAIFLLCCRRR
jgi:hypothetical protein